MDKLQLVYVSDVVNVVRCKDCKHAHMTYGGECKYCDIITMLDAEGDPCAMYLPGDWFCAAGERRETQWAPKD